MQVDIQCEDKPSCVHHVEMHVAHKPDCSLVIADLQSEFDFIVTQQSLLRD